MKITKTINSYAVNFQRFALLILFVFSFKISHAQDSTSYQFKEIDLAKIESIVGKLEPNYTMIGQPSNHHNIANIVIHKNGDAGYFYNPDSLKIYKVDFAENNIHGTIDLSKYRKKFRNLKDKPGNSEVSLFTENENLVVIISKFIDISSKTRMPEYQIYELRYNSKFQFISIDSFKACFPFGHCSFSGYEKDFNKKTILIYAYPKGVVSISDNSDNYLSEDIMISRNNQHYMINYNGENDSLFIENNLTDDKIFFTKTGYYNSINFSISGKTTIIDVHSLSNKILIYEINFPKNNYKLIYTELSNFPVTLRPFENGVFWITDKSIKILNKQN